MAQDTTSNMSQSTTGRLGSPRQIHRLRTFIVVNLIILTIQGWFGDTVNIFVAPPGTNSSVQFSALLPTITNYGFFLIWHAFEGLLLVVLSIALIVASFRWSKKRSVRILSILGALMIISATIGGLSFVLSGFNAGGSSAQMGGSFIGAYTFYFMELYYTK
jgi:hypothetical protein